MQGLRVQDTREISPWDILEGVKYGGPLMLSWFGAVRMKRKPLKYEEQRKLVSLHSHQNRFKDMMYKPYYVSLPDPTPQTNPFADTPEIVCDSQPPGKVEAASDQESSNKLVTVASTAQMAPGATTTNSTHVGMRPQVASNQMQHPVSMQGPYARHPMQQPNPTQMSRSFVHHVHGGTQGMIQIESPSNMPPHHTGMETQPQPFQADMREKLRGIQAMQRGRYPQSAVQPPPMYPGHTVSQMPRPPGGYAVPQRMMQQEVFARMNPQQRAFYIQQRQRLRQQQQQRAMAAMAVARRPTMMGQFNPQYQPMRPLQAAPAVPMQQVGNHSMVLFRYQNVPLILPPGDAAEWLSSAAAHDDAGSPPANHAVPPARKNEPHA